MNYLRSYIATLVAFLVIDLAWVSFVLQPFYRQQLGALMQETPDMLAGIIFYLGYVAGIVYLAVVPALEQRSVLAALVRGAVLGALAYGTYTVSNYAIFEAWTPALLASDIAWGTALTSICATCGFLASR